MPFHMEAFSVSNTTSGANTLVQVTYVTTNNVFQAQNSGMTVDRRLNKLHSVMGLSASMTGIEVRTPAFLPFPYPSCRPVTRGTAFGSPPRIFDYSASPLPMNPSDEFDVYAAQNSGGTETQYVACNFTDGQRVPIPIGKMFTAHATSATTLSAAKFTPCALTLTSNALPGGLYACIGARAFSATGRFFRFLPTQDPIFRPGGVCVQAYDQMDAFQQRGWNWAGQANSGWGTWLHFYQNLLPQIEVYATSADTAQEFDLDLVLVSTATI